MCLLQVAVLCLSGIVIDTVRHLHLIVREDCFHRVRKYNRLEGRDRTISIAPLDFRFDTLVEKTVWRVNLERRFTEREFNEDKVYSIIPS